MHEKHALSTMSPFSFFLTNCLSKLCGFLDKLYILLFSFVHSCIHPSVHRSIPFGFHILSLDVDSTQCLWAGDEGARFVKPMRPPKLDGDLKGGYSFLMNQFPPINSSLLFITEQKVMCTRKGMDKLCGEDWVYIR